MEYKSVMPAGNSSASNMESLLMDKCNNNHKMIHLEPSSRRQAQASMSPDHSFLISNLQLSIKLELEHIDNSIIHSKWYQQKKMRQITLQEDTTLLENRLLILLLIESEKWLIIAQDYKVSSSTIHLEEVLDQV